MFTVTIRVNERPIAHLSGKNVATVAGSICKYEYDYHDVDDKKLHFGTVTHDKRNGIRELISTIFGDIDFPSTPERAG